ncbi:hypothetical protein Pla52o_32810 [Novipirellula galeiformis]|uniref:Uncharacterized protein n=1 Tax=Novipirellula galeiformis TaxID=2528004 RepID=A0A5C6CDX9_9BACT|nr:hypothetical protein [Novipirellula galeiformis]TWU22225.1 hypothetical protein Pla52o_32810 [Novipirellula galeiformis]
MNLVLRILSVAVVCAFCVESQAGDPFRSASSGAISQSSMSAMGLSDVTPMSHQEASAIRGQGGVVWGSSWAGVNLPLAGAGGDNGYRFRGNYFAAGANQSYADGYQSYGGAPFGLAPVAAGASAGGFSIGGSF